MSLGKKMRYIRQQLNLTQEEMVEKLRKGKKYCDVTAGALSRYELEKRYPDGDFFKAYCDCFKVNADWLICGNGSPFREEGKQMDIYEIFFMLCTLLEKEDFQVFNKLETLEFEAVIENSPKNFLLLLFYMLKSATIRRTVFKIFHYFLLMDNEYTG